MFNFFKYFIYEDQNDQNVDGTNLNLSNSEFLVVLNQDELKKIIDKNYLFEFYNINFVEEGLKKEAIAFCIFVNNNLAHITWLALNDTAKKFVDDWPMKIDWINTAVWGLAFTHSKFRKNGFYQYVHEQIKKFLLSKNIKFNRFTIKKRNLNSISALSKFKPKNIANGYSFELHKLKFRLSIPFYIK